MVSTISQAIVSKWSSFPASYQVYVSQGRGYQWYQSTPHFTDQWDKPDDTSDNAENLKTGHGEVGKRAGGEWWSGSELRLDMGGGAEPASNGISSHWPENKGNRVHQIPFLSPIIFLAGMMRRSGLSTDRRLRRERGRCDTGLAHEDSNRSRPMDFKCILGFVFACIRADLKSNTGMHPVRNQKSWSYQQSNHCLPPVLYDVDGM